MALDTDSTTVTVKPLYRGHARSVDLSIEHFKEQMIHKYGHKYRNQPFSCGKSM